MGWDGKGQVMKTRGRVGVGVKLSTIQLTSFDKKHIFAVVLRCYIAAFL